MTRKALFTALALLGTVSAASALTAVAFAQRRAAVTSLVAARDYPAAEAAARALLVDAETTLGAGALEAAQAIDVLVDSRLGQRAADEECLALAERAVRIKEETAGPEDPETAESIYRLALVLQARQRFDDALAPMERALAIREARFGKGSPEAALLQGRLAYLYRDLNRPAQAVQLLREALAAHEASSDEDPASLAPLVYNLAVLEHDLGNFDEAERDYHRLLRMTPAPGQERSIALNGLARIYVERARYAEAQDAFEEAIAGARAAGAHPSLIAYYLHNLGFLLTEIGSHDEAVPIFDEVLRLRRDLLGNEHTDTASTLSNLADAHLRLGDADTALRLHQEALGIRERVLGPDHGEVATSLRALGHCYLEVGRPADALPLLERGLRIQAERSGPAHHDTGEMTADLARALSSLGRTDEAARHFENALEILGGTLGADDPEWSRTRLDLARADAHRGSMDRAWEGALDAEARLRAHARLTSAALSEQQAVRYAASTKEAMDLVLDLLPRRSDPDAVATALDRVVRSRALALDVVASRHAALAGDRSPATDELARAYAEASRRLASLLVQGGSRSDERAGAVRRAREERDGVERDLARRSAAFRQSLARQETGLPDLLESLPAGAGMLSYVRVERRRADGTPDAPVYLAFLGRADREPQRIELGSGARIDGLVREWRSRVTAGDPSSRGSLRACLEAGAALREAIWDPVVALAGGLDLLFVVPDGELHRVAFYGLPDGAGGYLVESGPTIHYLSAERDLQDVAPRAAPGTGLLAVGDADFGVATPGRREDRFASVQFAPLPGTGEEAKAIAALWDEAATRRGLGKSTILLGTEATETAVKAAVRGRRVVHLATHGFFLDGNRPGVPGTRSIGGLSARRQDQDPGRLALSGLAFAGANRPVAGAAEVDDGILTAQEIAALDLTAADWVVLAACDTGLGEVAKGEGVLGLRRAFEVSGARSLVMSLWEVDDDAALAWMTALYRARLERNASTAAALREATRATLAWCRERHRSDHPFYWSAFVAVGDWR